MQKVSLTKLQTKYIGISLKEAKSNVDRLLDGERIELKLKSTQEAQEFVREARGIGVICEAFGATF